MGSQTIAFAISLKAKLYQQCLPKRHLNPSLCLLGFGILVMTYCNT